MKFLPDAPIIFYAGFRAKIDYRGVDSMKITVVMENSVPARVRRPFLAEHGLSMLLDTGSKLYLFDTGQTDAVVHNLGLLGIHPAQLDGIILSHGHYDHTGGLKAILTHDQKEPPCLCKRRHFHFSVFRRTSRPFFHWHPLPPRPPNLSWRSVSLS